VQIECQSSLELPEALTEECFQDKLDIKKKINYSNHIMVHAKFILNLFKTTCTEGWGGKCSGILAMIKLLLNPRVNKVFIAYHVMSYRSENRKFKIVKRANRPIKSKGIY